MPSKTRSASQQKCIGGAQDAAESQRRKRFSRSSERSTLRLGHSRPSTSASAQSSNGRTIMRSPMTGTPGLSVGAPVSRTRVQHNSEGRCFRRGNRRHGAPSDSMRQSSSEDIPSEMDDSEQLRLLPTSLKYGNIARRASVPAPKEVYPSTNPRSNSVAECMSRGDALESVDQLSLNESNSLPPAAIRRARAGTQHSSAIASSGLSSATGSQQGSSSALRTSNAPIGSLGTSELAGNQPLEALDPGCALAKRVYFCRTPWGFKEAVERGKISRPSIQDVTQHLKELRDISGNKRNNWVIWELNINKEPLRSQFASEFDQQILPYRLPAVAVAPLSVLVDFCSSLLWWLELDCANVAIVMYQDNHPQYLYVLASLLLNLGTASMRTRDEPMKGEAIPTISSVLDKLEKFSGGSTAPQYTEKILQRSNSICSKLGWIPPTHWGATCNRYLRYFHHLLTQSCENETLRLKPFVLKSIFVQDWIGPLEGLLIEVYHLCPSAIEHGKLKYISKKESKMRHRKRGANGYDDYTSHIYSSPSFASWEPSTVTPDRRASIPSSQRRRQSRDCSMDTSVVSSKVDAAFDELNWGMEAIQKYLKFRKEKKNFEKVDPLLSVYGKSGGPQKLAKPPWDDVTTLYLPTTDSRKANQVSAVYCDRNNTCSATFDFKACASRRSSHRDKNTPNPNDCMAAPDPIILCGDVLLVLRQTEPQSEDDMTRWVKGVESSLLRGGSRHLFENGPTPKSALKKDPPLVAACAFHTSFLSEEPLTLSSDDFDFYFDHNDFERKQVSTVPRFQMSVILERAIDYDHRNKGVHFRPSSDITPPRYTASSPQLSSQKESVHDILNWKPIGKRTVPSLDLTSVSMVNSGNNKRLAPPDVDEAPLTTTRSKKSRSNRYLPSRLLPGGSKKGKDQNESPPLEDRHSGGRNSKVPFLKARGSKSSASLNMGVCCFDAIWWQGVCAGRIRHCILPTVPAANIYEFYRRHIRIPDESMQLQDSIEWLVATKLCLDPNVLTVMQWIQYYFDLPSSSSRVGPTQASPGIGDDASTIRSKSDGRLSKQVRPTAVSNPATQNKVKMAWLHFTPKLNLKDWFMPSDHSKTRISNKKLAKHDATFMTSYSTQSVDIDLNASETLSPVSTKPHYRRSDGATYPSFCSPTGLLRRASLTLTDTQLTTKTSRTRLASPATSGFRSEEIAPLGAESDDDYRLVAMSPGIRKHKDPCGFSPFSPSAAEPVPSEYQSSETATSRLAIRRNTLGSPAEHRLPRLSLSRPSVVQIAAADFPPPKLPYPCPVESPSVAAARSPSKAPSEPKSATDPVTIAATTTQSPRLVAPRMPQPLVADITRGSAPPGDGTRRNAETGAKVHPTAALVKSLKKPPPSRKSDGPVVVKKKAPPPKAGGGGLEALFAKKSAAVAQEAQPKGKAPFGRKLFWKPLPPDLVKNTVFDELHMNDDGTTVRLEFSVDTGVASRVFVKETKKAIIPKSKTAADTKTYATIFDSKRAQNVSIVVKRLPCPPEIYAKTLLELRLAECMSAEALNKLEVLMVTEEEERDYADFFRKGGDLAELRPMPEQQLVHLRPSRIPRMQQRFRMLIFSQKQPTETKDFERNLLLLRQACHEMRGSQTFRYVLAAVLRWGNFVNHGTQKQAEMQIRGITLASLLKLTEFKTTIDQNVTSLHYIVATMISLAPDSGIADLVSELRSVKAAARVSGEGLENSWKMLQSGLSLMRTEVFEFADAYRALPDETDDRGLRQLELLCSNCEADINSAEVTARETMTLVISTAKFFGDDSPNPQMLNADFSTGKLSFQYGTLFSTFQAFLLKYEEAIRDIIRRPAVYVKLVPEEQVTSLISFVERTTGRSCPASIKPNVPAMPKRKMMPQTPAPIPSSNSQSDAGIHVSVQTASTDTPPSKAAEVSTISSSLPSPKCTTGDSDIESPHKRAIVVPCTVANEHTLTTPSRPSPQPTKSLSPRPQSRQLSPRPPSRQPSPRPPSRQLSPQFASTVPSSQLTFQRPPSLQQPPSQPTSQHLFLHSPVSMSVEIAPAAAVVSTSPDRTGLSSAVRYSNRPNMPPPAPAGLYTLVKR
eukprot:Gregarina_sp_Poly_1__10193@NODE_702_length_6683_cov_53_863513_g530_i0_p1_GENE_NODE_702_length_6683_cov_53_863513_g530_i0NODE_702_length_6683_cov_53_863513_g530_i0_p1_ORF_typecomplete_len2075_score298_95FH2/PF02181_23/2_7e61PTEN_C2/PF10409_9/0_004_NODE_702_length_6683_cov_53_863513_g530_i03916615